MSISLILAAGVLIVGIVWTLLKIWAVNELDAPSQSSISIWPGLIISIIIAGVLAFSHFGPAQFIVTHW